MIKFEACRAQMMVWVEPSVDMLMAYPAWHGLLSYQVRAVHSCDCVLNRDINFFLFSTNFSVNLESEPIFDIRFDHLTSLYLNTLFHMMSGGSSKALFSWLCRHTCNGIYINPNSNIGKSMKIIYIIFNPCSLRTLKCLLQHFKNLTSI